MRHVDAPCTNVARMHTCAMCSGSTRADGVVRRMLPLLPPLDRDMRDAQIAMIERGPPKRGPTEGFTGPLSP